MMIQKSIVINTEIYQRNSTNTHHHYKNRKYNHKILKYNIKYTLVFLNTYQHANL